LALNYADGKIYYKTTLNTIDSFTRGAGGTGGGSVDYGTGITAFNNLTSYTASGTTGSTSSNLVFSNVPTLSSPILNTAALSAPTFSTSAAISAGADSQGQAALISDFNVITSTANNPSGVTLPAATVGRRIVIANSGTNTVNVYPATGTTISGFSVNEPIPLGAGGYMEFIASSITKWYSTSNISLSNIDLAQLNLAGALAVNKGGTGVTSPSLTAFNNITGYTTGSTTGQTSSNLVFSSSPTLVTPTLTSATLTTPNISAATFSTSATVTAGTNAQGQGALTSDFNVVTVTPNNPSGVTLPTATTGRRVVVSNDANRSINIYPASGAAIDGYSTNISISLPVGGYIEFVAGSNTKWYSTSNISISNLNLTNVSSSGVLATTNGGTGLSGFTANKAIYSTSTSALTSGTLPVVAGGTGSATAGIASFNNITGYTASGATGTTSTNLVFSTSPQLTTPSLIRPTFSTSSSITAGTDAQGQSPLTADFNVVTSTPNNPSGVTLPTAAQGRRVVVSNDATNTIKIYPAANDSIDGYSLNAAIPLTVGGYIEFVASSGSKWYSTSNISVTNIDLNQGSGTLAVNKGGTGLSSLTVGGALYATSTTALTSGTLPVTSGGTGLTTLTAGGALYASTGSALTSGTLPTTAGGTGLTSFTANRAIYATATNTLTSGVLPVAAGGTNSSTAGITSFNNITGYTASGATGTTSTNLVFSTSPSLTTPALTAPTFSTSATVTAGTNAQGQAALTGDFNVVTSTPNNPSGVTLPTATVGRRIVISNDATNPINIYPAVGASIDGYSANQSISLAVGGYIEFVAGSTTKWYSTSNISISNIDLAQLTISGALAVAKGGTGSNTAGIGTFNNITGYSAAGATGTTSSNLVFSTAPLLTAPTFSTSANVTAGFNAQGQGALTSDFNVIRTANSTPSAVTLPTATVGRRVVISNDAANTVNIYPASGASIDGYNTNVSIPLTVGGYIEFVAGSTTKWYSTSNISISNLDLSQLSTAGALQVSKGGTGSTTAGITTFNNITGYSASGATGTTSTNLVFSTSPSLTTPSLTAPTFSTTPSVIAGTNAQDQAPLTADFNVIVNTPNSPSGVTLPTATQGRRVVVANDGTNSISIYPASGASIGATAVNQSISLAVGGYIEFIASSSTKWYYTNNLASTGGGTGGGTGSIALRVVTSAATSGNITPTAGTADQYNILGLTGNITVVAPSGTATDGQRLLLKIEDNGVASRTITWSSNYREVGAQLPLSTTPSKMIYVGCVYNSQEVYWDVVAVSVQV
jgi:hypothetical protein